MCEDFWKLPLLSGDHVTIDWESQADSNGNPYAYSLSVWPRGTTDYSINNSTPEQYFTIGDNNRAESKFVVGSSGIYPLEFIASAFTTCGVGGPYDFITYVRHSLVLGLPRLRSITSSQTLRIGTHYVDGTPISDSGLRVQILGRWAGRWHLLGSGSPANGRALVKIHISNGVRGHKIALSVIGSGVGYLRQHKTLTAVRVK
jgi:hypothetical protein